MPLAAGTRLGAYEVLAPLGAGGMGEVYRARDTRLGRDVAIKVLPQHLSTHPEVRARFEREARTISGLNHPNICVLHDIGRQGETDFLVMELVEGETLESRLRRGALPVAEAMRIGIQIADALERAHRAGVIHRDLKPGNIMLTRAGAKLMDFGLARDSGLGPAGGSSSGGSALTQTPTMASPLTAEGTIVGTFQYMAPELLEAREADARSDLWALGCVLYEMVTGSRAFDAPSQASLIAAIMDREPRAMTDLQPVTPPALERVVRRCLQKAPDDRLQNAGDVAFALGLIADGGVDAPAAGASVPRRSVPIRAMVAAGLLAAIAAWFVGRASIHPAPGSLRIVPLTYGNRDSEPAVSPDGRLVVFSAARPGGGGLWLMDVATRNETRLTTGADNLPRFSADGSTVYFTRQTDRGLALWRVATLGGPPRLVLENASDADCSPDGARLVYLAGSVDSAVLQPRLMTARIDGTDARELWAYSGIVLASPRWSPNGEQVAAIRSSSQNTPNAVLVVNARDGRVKEFPSPHLAFVSSACWDGTGRGLILAESENIVSLQAGGQSRLLRLDTGSGAYRSLGGLAGMPVLIDLLPDGRLVMGRPIYRASLREVPLDARSLGEGRWLTQGSSIDRQPVYSPDGQWVMFSSNRGGTLDLWEVSIATGELHRITDDPANDWDPAYSRDGSQIYWSSDRTRAFEIWSARRDGSAPRQVSHDSLDAENPAVLPDGSSILYSSANPRKSGLWRVLASGGAGEQVMAGGTLIPDVSPDGRLVTSILGVGTLVPQLLVYDLEHRRPLPHTVPLRLLSPDAQAGRSRWTPDGRSIVYIAQAPDGRYSLVRQSLDAWTHGSAPADTLFPGSQDVIESFGISSDGRRLVASVMTSISGLSVVEDIQGIVPPRRNPAASR